MIKLNPSFVSKLHIAKDISELYPLVQNAIELEHATIPPYLTAMFSLKPNTEREIWGIIHSIVIEEMLHMTIAANILNALGGKPKIDSPKFVPKYPGPLPMGIGDKEKKDGDEEKFIVNLQKFSKDAVKNTFMEIEEPEDPLELPIKKSLAMGLMEVDNETNYNTIGEFYTALKHQINLLAPEDLPGDPSLQVTSPFFDSSVLFPILKKQDADKAIDIIIEQGEGTTTSPIDFEGEISHYYKFEEIYVGKRLVKDPTVKPEGYSFSGAPINFDPANVYPLFPNTKASMLKEGSQERRRVDEFNQTYTSLLKGLHDTFNGKPDHLNQTIGLMYDIKLQAEKLCGTKFPGKPGFHIGPTFELDF